MPHSSLSCCSRNCQVYWWLIQCDQSGHGKADDRHFVSCHLDLPATTHTPQKKEAKHLRVKLSKSSGKFAKKLEEKRRDAEKEG